MGEKYSSRQRACCPSCGKIGIAYDKKAHLMHCHSCGANWHKSMSAHREVKIHNRIPKCWQQIMEKKAGKKTRPAAGEVITC